MKKWWMFLCDMLSLDTFRLIADTYIIVKQFYERFFKLSFCNYSTTAFKNYIVRVHNLFQKFQDDLKNLNEELNRYDVPGLQV